MKFTHIRHGSHFVEVAGMKFIVDPVLADKGSTFALPRGRVKDNNPLVDLPFDKKDIGHVDGVIITHMHFDHFDEVAMEVIDKTTAIYCTPADVKKLKKAKFVNVIPIHDEFVINQNVKIKTVKGKHGTGLAGKLMGRTTGYILENIKNEKKTYIIGDSIWCDSVKETLEKYQPEVVIAFAGEARLPFGKAITMSTYDIEQVSKYSNAKIIVIHLDTWNHCFLTRDKLKLFLKDKSYKNNILIPEDGEVIDMEI